MARPALPSDRHRAPQAVCAFLRRASLLFDSRRHQPRRRRSTLRNAVARVSLLSVLVAASGAVATDLRPLPDGFVRLDEAIPDLVVELRYATDDNFVGRPVDSYGRHARAILTAPAADALFRVQTSLRPFGLGLKVFDAYRPQRAVDHFVRWGRDLADRRNKAEYYPDVAKKDLFSEGYIAARSSHSRGSTVDLTIVHLDADGTVRELDMGSGYDFFGPVSWPDSTAVTGQQRANRALLRQIMTTHGFTPYAQEWWHFTYADEPYPDTYFDFPIDAKADATDAVSVQASCEAFARAYAKRTSGELADDSIETRPASRVAKWLSNAFQPDGSRFVSGYRCRFSTLDRGGDSRVFSVGLYLAQTRAFAEHTLWEDTQSVPVERVVDADRGMSGYGVFKYLREE